MSNSIVKIHVAKRDLGLDDDTYRAKLANITGKSSVKDMTETERQQVLEVFRSEGFKPKADRRPDGRPKLSGRFAGKLQALWIAGWNLGVFKNRDDAALEAFVKRQTGLDAVRFCRDANDARKAIEALKAILAREGGVDWSESEMMPPHTQNDGYRICRAQWEKLHGLSGFIQEAHKIAGRERDFSRQLTAKEYILVMNELGKQIRAKKAGG